MLITLACVGGKPRPKDAFEDLISEYLKRCVGVVRCDAEAFRTEKALLEWVSHKQGRTPPVLMLLDERGRQMTSAALAEWLRARLDEGKQHVVFAVGPADGWSDRAREEARRRGSLLALGPMTFAHQLARLIMAEQIYRACTILTGHPYHIGH